MKNRFAFMFLTAAIVLPSTYAVAGHEMKKDYRSDNYTQERAYHTNDYRTNGDHRYNGNNRPDSARETMYQRPVDRTAGDLTQTAKPYPTEVSRGFTQRDREALYNYLKLPSNQRSIREDIRAKEHAVPGALIGSRLSPQIAVSDLGVKMERKLTPPKPGVKFGAVGVDLVAIDLNTRQVIDYVPNVIPEYIK